MATPSSTELGTQSVVLPVNSPNARSAGSGSDPSSERPRSFARLGTWAATHFRHVLAAWLFVIAGFGSSQSTWRAHWQGPVGKPLTSVCCCSAVIQKDFAGLGATDYRWSWSTTSARSRRTTRPRPSWPSHAGPPE